MYPLVFDDFTCLVHPSFMTVIGLAYTALVGLIFYKRKCHFVRYEISKISTNGAMRMDELKSNNVCSFQF